MRLDWTNPYLSARSAVFARSVVTASHPLAAQAGLRVLAQGGNAVDAAVAGAAVLAIVDPTANGLGADCCALIWDGARLHGLNATGPSPARWDAAYFQRKHQGVLPERGWDSVTVPGAVAGWTALHARFGLLSLSDVLGPAIEYAEKGYAVSVSLQRKWLMHADALAGQPGFAEHFLPFGRSPAIGEHFVLRGAAGTLRRIASSGGRDFYEGETAHKLVAHAQAHDAVLSLSDLRGYTPLWSDPVSLNYRGHAVHQLAPNGAGIGTLIALGILSHYDIGEFSADRAETQHLLIEAAKLAQGDVQSVVADARAMTVCASELLDPAHLRSLSRRIDAKRAQIHGPAKASASGAACLTAADRNGMMVSLVQSNHVGFGAGVIVPGTGISLQNRGSAFDPNPAHPNGVAGNKLPLQTGTPCFVSRDGAPLLSVAAAGEGMQVQAELQWLVRLIDYGQQPQAAADAPRWKWRHGLSVSCEPTMPAALRACLGARGHMAEAAVQGDFGSAQAVLRLGDPAVHGYAAASDSRRDGLAAGF